MTKTNNRKNEKHLAVKSARKALLPDCLEHPQERADGAIICITEAMEELALGVGKTVHAIMYYIPAKGAEPECAINCLRLARAHFKRAEDLLDGHVRSIAPPNYRGQK